MPRRRSSYKKTRAQPFRGIPGWLCFSVTCASDFLEIRSPPLEWVLCATCGSGGRGTGSEVAQRRVREAREFDEARERTQNQGMRLLSWVRGDGGKPESAPRAHRTSGKERRYGHVTQYTPSAQHTAPGGAAIAQGKNTVGARRHHAS